MTMQTLRRHLSTTWVTAALVVLGACGGGDGAGPVGAPQANVGAGGGSNAGASGGNGGGGVTPSNKARFTFDCDLQGIIGELTLDVEVISNAGVVFGPGPTPDITAVIGTGDVTLLTSGELSSSAATYIFTGENQFADFTKITGTIERFLVEWVETANGITMVINPFGPGTTRQDCLLTGSSFL